MEATMLTGYANEERMIPIAFSPLGIIFTRPLTRHEAQTFSLADEWAAVRFITARTAAFDDARCWLKVKRSWSAAAVAVQLLPPDQWSCLLRGLHYHSSVHSPGIRSGLPSLVSSVGEHLTFLLGSVDVGYIRGEILGPSAQITFIPELIGFGRGYQSKRLP
jgi:hypothetical protein